MMTGQVERECVNTPHEDTGAILILRRERRYQCRGLRHGGLLEHQPCRLVTRRNLARAGVEIPRFRDTPSASRTAFTGGLAVSQSFPSSQSDRLLSPA